MRPERNRTSTFALAALSTVVLVSPVLRGGVDWPTQATAAALLLVAWGVASRRWVGAPMPFLLLLVPVAATVLQVLPVPAWAHSISPATRRIFDVALAPLGAYPTARPLSLDPPLGGRSLVHAVVVVAAFSCAFLFAGTRNRRRLLIAAIAGAGTLTGAASLAAALVGVGPLTATRVTFVNPNHLASCCALSAFTALGLAMRHRDGKRLLWLSCFLVCGASVFLSLSRGGILAFVLGSGVFAFFALRSVPRRDGRRWTRPALLGLAGSLLVGLVLFLALDPVLDELRTLRGVDSEARAGLLGVGLRMALDFPFTGIGRGAFTTAAAGYKLDAVSLTFTHIENSWLQPLIDLGWPVGLLLIGTFAWIWVRAARRPAMSLTDVGLLAGTAAVAIHDAADFSLELIGVAVPFVTALGLLGSGMRSVRLPRVALQALPGVLAIAAAGGLLLDRAHPIELDERPIQLAADAATASAAARSAALWHPADYLPHTVAGARWIAEGRCTEGLPWLWRAMILNPTAAEPHRLIATCLLASGQRQLAKREVHLAIAYGDPTALEIALRAFPVLDELLEAVPETPDALWGLSIHLSSTRKPDAAVVLRRLRDDFADERAELPLGRLLLEEGDSAGALDAARRRMSGGRSDPETVQLAASALSALGDDTEAQHELERGLLAHPGAAPILSELAARAFARKHYLEAEQLAERIAPATPSEAASRDIDVARALAAQGRYGEAVVRARSAVESRPDWPGAYEGLADICRTAHRFEEAVAALQAARGLAPGHEAGYDGAIAALQAQQAAQGEERLRQLLPQDTPPGAKTDADE